MDVFKDIPTMMMSNTLLISNGNICPLFNKKWSEACASGTAITFRRMPFDA
jgi:hypothetical protein